MQVKGVFLLKIEKIKIIKDIARKIYFNFNVLNVNKIIYQLENVSTRRKLRKLFINVEKDSPYGLNVDDIVHTFFNEKNEKRLEELADILIMYLYEYIKSGDSSHEYFHNRG
jgi:hypothetical protein